MERKNLGPYEILEPLGKGGMGDVYRARDSRLGREVAVKLVAAERLAHAADRADGEEPVEALLREARTAASLNHPHVCTIHEVGEQDGQAYIGMELVEGETLASHIPADGLPSETVIRVGAQVAAALAHAHSKGVVHRDLKPGNVMLTPSGDAKVLDFGVAFRFGEEDLDQIRTVETTLAEVAEDGGARGAIVGTLSYMAPEVLQGQGADERSDLWALGVLLYEAASGERPFAGQTGFALTSAILKDPCPELPEGAPPGLAAVIRRCLSKEPGLRYRNAGEVQTALEMLEAGAAVATEETTVDAASRGARAPPLATTGWRSLLRGRRLPVVTLVAVAVVAVATVALDLGGVHTILTDPASPDPGGSASVPPIRSLAVLPLENHSGPDQEYFSDGMTEALTAELAQIGALKVISRTSAMQYEATDKLMPEVADELGVDALVEGSVLQAGDGVRITVQLVHGPTDRHLWAGSYEREVRDILALQGEVAQAVAREIQITVGPEEQARLEAGRPVDPEAYRLVLRGDFHLRRGPTEDSFRRALSSYQEALEIDEDYAVAHAGVAWAHVGLGSWFASTAPGDAIPRAREAAERALDLDPDLPLAHLTLAWIQTWFEWDWAGAERAFERTIALNPSSSRAHANYGFLLAVLGRTEEAIEMESRAVELDPLNPSHYFDVAAFLDLAGRGEEAMAMYREGFELDPDHLQGHGVIGEFHFMRQGEFDEAVSHHMKVLEIQEMAMKLGMLGYIHGVAGQTDEASGIRARLMERREDAYVPATALANVQLGLGEHDEALRWLETAYEEGDTGLVWLKEHWMYEPLRDDPRYQDLVRRMGFPD